MKTYTRRISLISKENFELIDVTDTVKKVVSESNIKKWFFDNLFPAYYNWFSNTGE